MGLIKKAIIPVAGKGTRFLPATKQTPKEMLPIINKPMIDYAVEEAVLSGIEQIVFVTSKGKEAIENYFDRNFELEGFLEQAGKQKYLDLVRHIGSKVEVFTVRQKEALGLGHAISCAKPFFQPGEQFAVILADDLVLNPTPVTEQLIQASQSLGDKSVIGVMEVAPEDTHRYGIIDAEKVQGQNQVLKMLGMVEKPDPASAPSNLATPGRYILSYDIFDCLEKIEPGAGGEYQLTDAIRLFLKNHETYAFKFEGKRYDTGNVPGYLRATVDFALENEETSEVMRNIILEKAKQLQAAEPQGRSYSRKSSAIATPPQT